MATKKTRVNQEIDSVKVRLIDAQGEQQGVVSMQQALLKAQEANLDLVEISPNAEPPVCRIMDFGKYKFQQNKRRLEQKKKQKQIQIKEIKFRPTTDANDYAFKLRKILGFLAEGDKVKITVGFRGRELSHQHLGENIVARIEADIANAGQIEQRPKMLGRQIVMVIAPTSGK